MLTGRGRIPPRDRLSLSHGEMPWEADVTVSAAGGKIGDLNMAGSHTRSKKQTDKQREQGKEQRELVIQYTFPTMGSLAKVAKVL